MKKNLYILILLLLSSCFLLFFSCGSKFRSAKTSVVFFNAEALPEQVKMIKEIIAGFEKENPDVRITHISGDGNLSKLQTMMAAGVAPDIFMWWDETANLVAKDQLAPLNEFVTKYNIDMSQYWKCLTDLYTYDGTLYAMPLQLKTCAIVYNKVLFDREGLAYPKADWTWKDLYNLGLKFRRDTDNDNVVDQFGTQFGLSSYMLSMNGAAIADDKQKICRLDKDGKALSVLDFLNMLQQDTGASMAESVNLVGGVGTSGFQTGKVAMLMAPVWMISMLNTIKDFEWGVAPIPVGLDGKRYDVFEGACLAIHKSSKNKDAAFRFMIYYCGPKGMAICNKYKNGLPALKKIAYDGFTASPNEKLKPYLDAGENANSYLGFKYITSSQMVKTAFQVEWENVYLKKHTVRQAAQIVTKQVNEILATERNQ